MKLDQLANTWNTFGKTDPLWAILSREDTSGNRWDKKEFFATGRSEIDGVLEYVREHATLHAGRALDFGCGVGRLSQALARHFDFVHGVDIAPSMIAQAGEFNQFPDKCTFHLNEQPNLSLFPDGHFDFIYSYITLQHMAPEFAHGYLREFARLLSPTGVLVFQLPTHPLHGRSRAADMGWKAMRSVYRLWRRRVRKEAVMDMFGTPSADVKALFETQGCRVVDVVEGDMDDWHSARYCVVPKSAQG